jgi:hypothetical protein
MGKAGEKQKRKPKTTDKRQYERFVETARKFGVDEDPATLDLTFRKLAPALKKPKT